MKSFRGTAVMTVLVAALAGYTFYEYKNADGNSSDQKLHEKNLFTLKAGQVDGIEFDHNGEHVVLNKNGAEWEMTQPVADKASDSSIDGFLFGLVNEKGRVFQNKSEAKNTKWNDYGLDPAGATVTLKSGKKSETVMISSKNAFDGSFYLKSNGELLLGDHGLAQVINRQASSFRSRRMWRHPDGAATDVQVALDFDKHHDHYEIKKDEKGHWSLTKAPKYKVDAQKISDWVERLQSFFATDIVQDHLDAKDKRTYLLLKPSMMVNVHYWDKDKKDQVWTLSVGQDRGGDIYLYSSERATLYKVADTVMAKLRVPLEFFRDGHMPFEFPLEQAHAIQIDTPKFKHRFEKKGSTWSLADKDGDKNLQLNQAKLVQLFQNIKELEAKEFLPWSVGKGLPAHPQISVVDGKGKKLLELSWGNQFKSTQPENKDMSFHYVRTNLTKDVLGVAADQVEHLVDPQMVVQMKAAPPKPAPKKE